MNQKTMHETRIICPEWAKGQDEDLEEKEINVLRRTDMKQNPTRCLTKTLRRHCRALITLRFLLLFFSLGTIGISGFAFMTSYEEEKDAVDGNISPSRHRDKRQATTCQVDMCLTQECIHAASSILKSMDNSVDPCDDFFKYTCGNWIKENKHKTGLEDLFYAINHNSLPQKTDLLLRELLRQNLPLPEGVLDTKPYQNLFTFHDSCIFVSHLPEGDYSEALEILMSLQEFQIGRPFDPSSWNLTKAILELMRINGAPLVDVTIQSDVKVPGKYAINITPPRRYGLIPSLIGPKIRNPGVKENVNLRNSRRALFGDLSDDLIMLELLSALEDKIPKGKNVVKDLNKSKKSSFEGRGSLLEERSGHVSNSVGKPSLNILPRDDILEKNNAKTTNLPGLTVRTPTTMTTTFTTTTTSTTPEPSVTTFLPFEAPNEIGFYNAMPIKFVPPKTTSHQPKVTATTTTETINLTTITSPATMSDISTTSSSAKTSSATTTAIPQSASFVPENVTELGPYFYESTDSPEYEDEDHIDYHESARKVVSRKAVFKLFRRNLDKKRTESIGFMVQNSFSNISEDVWASSFGEFQPDDIFSAVVEHFIPLLDEIQPTEQEELRAQQHALLYNHFTVDQLQKLVPMIEWQYLLSELFNKTITNEDNIYVYHPAYMTQLNHLLTALDSWIIHYGLVALYAYDILREVISAPPEMDREDFCLQATKNVFGDVMSHMYLHQVGNKTIRDLRRHTFSILNDLREEVRHSLNDTTWMTESDRVEALKKLNGLQAEVGALDKHWDITYVNKSHEKISLSSDDSFLQNVIVIYQTFRKELYQVYHEPVDRDTLIWSFTVQPFVVNAFHMQTTNTIVFPEAFFQNPYYNIRAPEYINYGSAGTSIAHEIFHGLDFTGTLFDHTGTMNEPFSNTTRFHLRKIVECYHRLLTDTFYEEVPVETTLIAMEIDSTSTLNENLADIGGIRHAFRAYQRWEADNYREPRLPALNLTPHQLFFISAVRPYCAVIPNLAKIFLMEMDEHLPNGMRMNAMLMNTPEFAQVFNCQAGDRMVANQTCPIFP